VPGPLFVPDGKAWVPQPVARGPWDPDALHGGPVAALMTRELEALPAPGPMRYLRVAVEIMRSVPLAPLTLEATTVRPGKKVAMATVTLRAGDLELCRATGWRVRVAGTPVCDPEPPEPPPPVPDEGRHLAFPGFEDDEVFVAAVEQKWVEGDWDVGPSVLWTRLLVPVVEGETPSPLQRALAIADFGNGVGAAVPWTSHVFINTDLTVSIEREPEGEWIALAAQTRLDPAGAGVAETVISDTRGRVGRGTQSLFVDRR
jgi:hypothetical protein